MSTLIMIASLIVILELIRRHYFEKMNLFVAMIMLSFIVSFMFTLMSFLTTTFTWRNVSDFISMCTFMTIVFFIFIAFPVMSIMSLFFNVKKDYEERIDG